MLDQNKLPPKNHNNPPDPIEVVLAEYDGTISEAQNWADGEPVTDEAGMHAVDAVLKEFKAYKSALAKAAKERTDPLHKAWKEEVAAVKVYTDDADRMQSALVATVAPFKARLAEEKRAAEKAAWEAAEKARREAEAIAAKANVADLDAQREAAAAAQVAIDADKAARAASKDGVKGMRTVTHHEVTDYRAALNWIVQQDRPAMIAFIDEYVRKNHRDKAVDGVRVWTDREAF